MKIDVIRKHFDQDKKDWIVETSVIDTGVTFVDMFSNPCEIDQHVPKMIEDAKRYNLFECQRCKSYFYKSKYYFYNAYDERYPLPPPVPYNTWVPHDCYECEEHCIVSKPINPICPNCKSTRDEGLYHTGKDNVILFNCYECNTEDQIIE